MKREPIIEDRENSEVLNVFCVSARPTFKDARLQRPRGKAGAMKNVLLVEWTRSRSI